MFRLNQEKRVPLSDGSKFCCCLGQDGPTFDPAKKTKQQFPAKKKYAFNEKKIRMAYYKRFLKKVLSKL